MHVLMLNMPESGWLKCVFINPYICSMIAASAGAETIYSCESSKTMYETAADVIKQNELPHKIQLFNTKSTDLKIPEHIPERWLSAAVTVQNNLLSSTSINVKTREKRIVILTTHGWLRFTQDWRVLVRGFNLSMLFFVECRWLWRRSLTPDWSVRTLCERWNTPGQPFWRDPRRDR